MTGNNPTLPLLSVCCLGYKHARFLEENVRSICAIDYPNIEIIAVDDGSQDNSVELLNRLAAEIPLKMTVIGPGKYRQCRQKLQYRPASGTRRADRLYRHGRRFQSARRLKADTVHGR